jgi:hypothetical protein
MVKCRYCGTEIKKEDAISEVPKVYYCSAECMEMSRDKNAKGKPPVKSARRELTDLIQKYYLANGYKKNEINWNLICAQIKNLVDTYGYKYSGIRYTLWYMVEIIEKPLFDDSYKGSILNLVPFEYINAQKYYQETKALEKAFEAFEGHGEKTVVRHNTQRRRRYYSVDF